MPGDSIFEPGDPEVRRRQALSLLNDYSHPWDVLAESLQNAVDAINRRYRVLLADAIGTTLDTLENAIENASARVIRDDASVLNGQPDHWESPAYIGESEPRWVSALAGSLVIDEPLLTGAIRNVQTAYKGRIKVTRDSHSRTLIVEDNGIGMSKDQLRAAVKKGVTFKGGFSDIGELGNGLTYLVCSCDDFRLDTSDGQEQASVSIQGMFSWIVASPTAPKTEPLSDPVGSKSPNPPGTTVTLHGVRQLASDYPDIFDASVSTPRLVHLLRTKTAIGQAYDLLRYPVYDGLRKNGVEVTLVDSTSAGTATVDVPFLLDSRGEVVRRLHSGASPPILSLQEAKSKVAMNLDVGGNAIEHIDIWVSASGRLVYYYSFLSDREWYRAASKSALLCDNPSATDLRTIGVYDLVPSIELAVKGMPTGVSVDPPITGFQGYWPNFSIIELDNALEFDEGRKTPLGRRVKMYRDCAEQELFNEIGTDLISKAIRDAIIPMNLAQMAKSKQDFVNRRLAKRAALSYSKVGIKNRPKFEQDTFALFHEMVGAGILPFYALLDSASNSTYDAIYQYAIPKSKLGAQVQLVEGKTGTLTETIIVEFKKSGEDVILDVANNTKFYYMMDLLVCWDIDAVECSKQSATLIPKPPGLVKYWGTTHELRLTPANFMNVGSGRPLDVLCLKELIDRLGKGTYNVP
jgi:hypothetical protein